MAKLNAQRWYNEHCTHVTEAADIYKLHIAEYNGEYAKTLDKDDYLKFACFAALNKIQIDKIKVDYLKESIRKALKNFSAYGFEDDFYNQLIRLLKKNLSFKDGFDFEKIFEPRFKEVIDSIDFGRQSIEPIVSAIKTLPVTNVDVLGKFNEKFIKTLVGFFLSSEFIEDYDSAIDSLFEKSKSEQAPVEPQPELVSNTSQKQEDENPVDEEKKEEVEFDVKSNFIPDEDETSDDAQKVSPVKFDYDKMIINLNERVEEKKDSTKSLERRIETINKLFTGLNPVGTGYEVHPLINGLFDFCMFKDNKFIGHAIIDPCMIHGNGYYMLANSETGETVAVPIKEEPEIVKKYLTGQALNVEEVEKCKNYIFNEPAVYTFIDLSCGKITNMKDYKDFGDTLNKVLIGLDNAGIQIPRLRVSEKDFKDATHFKLVSDFRVVSPLPNMPQYYTGLNVTVDGDNLTISDGQNISSLKLNNGQPE